MGRKILVTESQLRYIIENVDYVINEQRRLNIKIKKGKVRELGKGSPSKTDVVSFDSYVAKTPQDQWDAYLKNDATMVSLMNGRSKSFWPKLKQDATHKGYAVAALEEFNATYEQNKWETVTVGNKTTVDQVPIEGKEKKLPGVPLKFPSDLLPNSKFFVNNYYQLTDVFVQSVKQDIIDPIVKQMKLLRPKEGEPKAFLDSMSVLSSCSTLPNGLSPDGKTYSFEDLSRLRNQTATNYVIDELRKIGVYIPETFKPQQNWMGTNSKLPGTSGPSWNSNWDKNIKTQKRPEYEQYKYLDMDLMVGYNTNEEPNPITKEDDFIDVTSDMYNIKFLKPGRHLTYQLPKIIMGIVGTKKRKSNWKAKMLDCPWNPKRFKN